MKRAFPEVLIRRCGRIWAPEVEHVVQDPDRDGGPGVPPILGSEPPVLADDAFPAAEEGLDQGADIVLGGFTVLGGLALVGFRGDGEWAQATSASIKEPSKAFPRRRVL